MRGERSTAEVALQQNHCRDFIDLGFILPFLFPDTHIAYSLLREGRRKAFVYMFHRHRNNGTQLGGKDFDHSDGTPSFAAERQRKPDNDAPNTAFEDERRDLRTCRPVVGDGPDSGCNDPQFIGHRESDTPLAKIDGEDAFSL